MTDATRCDQCGRELEPGAAHECPRGSRELRSTTAATPSTKSGARPVKPSGSAVSVRQTAHVSPAGLSAPAPRLGAPSPATPAAAVAIADDDGYDPLIGTLLGEHYRIIERLGSGGMGTVYLVTHVHLKKKFAAKILNTETARRPDSLARFQQEAVSASRLDHENIVDVVNFGTSDDGTVYLVMEFLKGEPLNQILDKGPLGFEDTLRILVPVCRGLGAAHGAGIVHRDLKPENIFVARRSGRHVIKLLDFGVSKIKERSVDAQRLTQTGDVLGSPLYMSPEASRGELDVDARADIYAIGVMLYEMCTGRAPFTADNYLQVLYKHIQEAPPPPREHNPEIPLLLEAVILRCLAKDPAARYQHIEELAAALVMAVPGVELDAPIAAAAPSTMTSMDVPLPISASAPPVSNLTPAPTAAVFPLSASSASQSGRRPAPPPVAALVTPAPPPPPPPVTSRFGLIAGFLGTLGVLGFGGYALWQSRRVGDSADTVVRAAPSMIQPTTSAPPPIPAAAPVAPLAPVLAARDKAALSVDSTPPGATVSLDGVSLGATPLVVRVALQPGERALRVELGGFRAETRPVVLDRDLHVEVELKKLARDKPRAPALDIKVGR